MNHSYTLRISILILLWLYSCTGTKQYTKKGDKLQEAGMYEQAADMYYTALIRKPTNVDAQIGLKKNGQRVLDDKTSLFFKNHNLENHKEAVNNYKDAKEYYNKIRSVNVQLDFPEHYETYYTKSKNIYIDQLYVQANTLLNEQKFQEAEPILATILNLEPGYKDVADLKTIATVEPLYEKAVKTMNDGDFKTAFYTFEKITTYRKNYKQTDEYKAICLEKATFSLGLFPITNKTNQPLAESEKVYAYLITELVNARNPLLKIVDRNNIQKILDEQKIGMSGVVNESTAVGTGKLIGVKAVLLCQLIEATHEGGRPYTLNKDGWESYSVEKIDPVSKQKTFDTQYRKISYAETHGISKVKYTVHYQIISTETSQILFSDVVTLSKTDEVNYNSYQGNYKNLYPSQPVNGVTPPGTREFRNRFTQAKNLKSPDELGTEATKEIAQKITGTIINNYVR